ncbi:hypothetical protein EVAR_100518_1 [Eumeta japonica]|uniref:CCHC-type domain-containing protein n=1 Tax=Eumeta variegata TaxID=151549 RepID=A0A4C2A9Z8_EUMVA|nr:hypothetical protein EVAR_100518_1 [Eumeta japonica]
MEVKGSFMIPNSYWNIVSGKAADDEEGKVAWEKWPERDQKALATITRINAAQLSHIRAAKLPRAWNTLKICQRNMNNLLLQWKQRDIFLIQNLKVKLLEEADRKLQKEGERQQIAFTAKQNSKYERFKKSDNGKRNDHQSRKKSTVCFICGKPGHLLLAVIQEKELRKKGKCTVAVYCIGRSRIKRRRQYLVYRQRHRPHMSSDRLSLQH